MSLASEAVVALDEHLREAGTPVVIRRYLTAARTRVEDTVNAAVRITKFEDLEGRVDAFDGRAIISPTGLTHTAMPKKDDKIVFDGREYNVELVKPFMIADQHVRFELMLTGV